MDHGVEVGQIFRSVGKWGSNRILGSAVPYPAFHSDDLLEVLEVGSGKWSELFVIAEDLCGSKIPDQHINTRAPLGYAIVLNRRNGIKHVVLADWFSYAYCYKLSPLEMLAMVT